MNDEHAMRHDPCVWKAICGDLIIGCTFMWYGHGKRDIIFVTLKHETLKNILLSLHICIWPLFVMFNCVFVTFPCGIMGRVWYLIISVPDLCPLSYFDEDISLINSKEK